MYMTKEEFLEFLDFPREWLEYSLYPDELFMIQKAAMSKDEMTCRLSLKKYGLGSEHYRYGAFWWVIKNIGYSALDGLKTVMEKDPDEIMRGAALNDLVKLRNYETCYDFSFTQDNA